MLSATRMRLFRSERPTCDVLADWSRLRSFLHKIPTRYAWRGSFGVGLLVDDPSSGVPVEARLLVPDRDVRWVTLVDLPRRAWQAGPATWACVHRTSVRYGMPGLWPDPWSGYDSRTWPFPPAFDTLRACPTDADHLARVVNELDWAMTGAAFHRRPSWKPWRAAFHLAAGVSDGPRSGAPQGRANVLANPVGWMPRAYIGFSACDRDRVWEVVTNGDRQAYTAGFRANLMADLSAGMPVKTPCPGTFIGAAASFYRAARIIDLQFACGDGVRRVVRVTRTARVLVRPGQPVQDGEVIALDAPPGPTADWARIPPVGGWDRLARRVLGAGWLRAWARLWFDRQFVTVRSGLVHAPADLVAPAARDHARDGELYWDVSPALDWYDEDLDAFRFPPVSMSGWWALVGALPGEVAFDLTPAGLRNTPGEISGHRTNRRLPHLRGRRRPR